MEVISTYALEGVGSQDGVCGWHGCLGGGHAVAVLAVGSYCMDVVGDPWPVYVSALDIIDEVP